MSNVLLCITDKKKEIANLILGEEYSFSPRKYFNIKKVTIYDPIRIEKIVINKYRIKYARLCKIVQDMMDSDDTNESDYMICLDEIAKLKEMLLIKYEKFINRKNYESFLDSLLLIEKIIQERFVELKNNDIINLAGGR